MWILFYIYVLAVDNMGRITHKSKVLCFKLFFCKCTQGHFKVIIITFSKYLRESIPSVNIRHHLPLYNFSDIVLHMY